MLKFKTIILIKSGGGNWPNESRQPAWKSKVLNPAKWLPFWEDKVTYITLPSFRNGKLFIFKGGCVVADEQLDEVFVKLKDMLHSLKYGSITIIVQDGKIIQLEKQEKVRIK
jgi:hypothetical protein